MKRQIILLFIFLFAISTLGLSQQDPAILADKYLLQAKGCIDKKNYQCAKDYFKKIMALKVEVPDEFYYYYGKCLYNNMNFQESLEMLNKYVNMAKQKGQFYVQAIETIIDIEEGKS